MRRVAQLFAITVGLVMVLASPPLASADDSCAVEGTVTGIVVAVRRARGGLARVRITRPTRAAITPLRPGIVQVRMLEGASFTGTTRAPIRIVLSRAVSLRGGAVELPRGLPLERVDAAVTGPWVTASVSLGDGISLHRTALPCDALTVEAGEVPIVARAPREQVGPRWRARSERLWIFAEPEGSDALRLEVAPDASARFVELSRRGGFVNIVLRTARGAEIRAWARSTDLMR